MRQTQLREVREAAESQSARLQEQLWGAIEEVDALKEASDAVRAELESTRLAHALELERQHADVSPFHLSVSSMPQLLG